MDKFDLADELDLLQNMPNANPFGFLYVTEQANVSLLHSIGSAALTDQKHKLQGQYLGLARDVELTEDGSTIPPDAMLVKMEEAFLMLTMMVAKAADCNAITKDTFDGTLIDNHGNMFKNSTKLNLLLKNHQNLKLTAIAKVAGFENGAPGLAVAADVDSTKYCMNFIFG